MTSSGPVKGKTTTRVAFLVGWGVFTFVVGAGAFLALFWATGGLGEFLQSRSAPTLTASLPAPSFTRAPRATDAPTTVATAPTQAPALTAPPVSAANPCGYPPLAASGFLYGIQMNPFISDNSYFLGVVNNLNMPWVKAQIRWADLELTPGDFNWGAMDNFINTACEKKIRVMLSIVSAPAWTQASPPDEVAPPDDYQLYASMVRQVVEHYPGKIGAIEVWNEQNLDREWDTAAGVSPEEYVRLLQLTSAAIKQADPNLLVISGAPSPTGISCTTSFPECAPGPRVVVMDDASYLRRMVELGALDYADCVGTHSNGTNLPPEADGANPPPQGNYLFAGPWTTPHYSWALASQVDTYWEIVDGEKPMCVTEFGYAAAVDGQYPPNFGFAADISEELQGEYLVRAFDWMRDSGKVKGAWLFNLDYGPKGGDPAVDDNVIFSLLYQDGTARPAFGVIGEMSKP